MRPFSHLLPAWSGSTHAGHNRPIPNARQHSFKPKAIRIPALLSLFFLFTICLAWLEILLKQTVRPSKYYESHGISDGLKKRQAVSSGQCPAPWINARNLASLRSQHSALCSTYTTVFKPETTDLSVPMQTSFDQWLAIYSSMEALSELAESCGSSQFTSSALSSIISSLSSQATATSAPTSGSQGLTPSTQAQLAATTFTVSSPQSSSATFTVAQDIASTGITSNSDTPTETGVSTITVDDLENTITSPGVTTSPADAAADTTSPDVLTTPPVVSTNTTVSDTMNPTPGSTTNTTQPPSVTDSSPIVDTTIAANTTTPPEAASNTTTSDIINTTPSATDNTTVCEEQGQSCDSDCDASICTCQSSQIASRAYSKRADLSCLPDACACQQDPSNSTNYECGEDVNICNDICTGPFTPDGQTCYTCDSETCSCQDSSCKANTTQSNTEIECTSTGEICYSCDAESCICGVPVLYYTGDERLLRRDNDTSNSLGCFDQCFCSYDDDLAQWECNDAVIDYCSGSSTSSTSLLDPTPDATSPESTTSTETPLYTSTPDSTTSDSTTSDTSTSGLMDPEALTPYSTPSDSTTPTSTTPDSSTITPAPCTPGTACESCAADVCSCSSFPTIGASCTVNTCYCSRESQLDPWTCNSINLCALTSTTSTTEPDPSDSDTISTSSSNGNNSSNYYYARRTPASIDSVRHTGSKTRQQQSVLETMPPATNSTEPGQQGLGKGGMDSIRDSEHRKSIWAPRNLWGVMDKRQGIEILTGNYQDPIRDAWNYLLWTTPLTIRRTSSSIVSTTVAATFTLDVFPGGSTSWPSLSTTPPLATQPTVPACIPATFIQPILSSRAKRDGEVSYTKSVKPYVTRESTTVVVNIRDNYLEVTSNVPTITQSVMLTGLGSAALEDLSTQTITVETVDPDGSTQTLSVVVVQPSLTIDGGYAPSIQQLGVPQKTSVSLSGGDGDEDNNGSGSTDDGSGSESSGGGGGGGGGNGDTKSNPAGEKIQKLTDNQRVVDMPYSRGSYFGAMYAPALTAIVVKILFETMLAALKGMEPFERLHREQGATAEDSLCSQYLSSSLSWDTIRSIWTGSSLPLWTTIIYVMVSIAAPLASASMTVRPMDECFKDDMWKLCSPAWIIDLRFLRILEALLVICITLTLALLWSSWKYHAGVPTNPTSIASVAVLLNYEPLRHDLQAIDPEATADELERALEEYHFWLIPHSPSRNESRYGFVHAQTSNTLTTPTAPALPTFLAKFETRYNRLRPHLHSRHTVRLTDYIHLFTTFALLALLTTYRANTKNDAFNYFFASYTFWPKFLLVTLATTLDMQWKSLEREVRITEPYRRLYLGNARAENTILRSLNGTCWSNLPRALRDLFRYSHMWFEAIVGITAILSDANIIAVSGVLLTFSQTRAAYEWSSIIALTTTSFMFAMLLLTVFWWRRTDAVSSMPRSPDTVGAVLSYLCISQMAVDLANLGLENLGKEERDRVILGKGKRYKFGRMMGEDGKERFCIDYDGGDDVDEDGSGEGERSSWLKAKMDRPVPVRLST